MLLPRIPPPVTGRRRVGEGLAPPENTHPATGRRRVGEGLAPPGITRPANGQRTIFSIKNPETASKPSPVFFTIFNGTIWGIVPRSFPAPCAVTRSAPGGGERVRRRSAWDFDMAGGASPSPTRRRPLRIARGSAGLVPRSLHGSSSPVARGAPGGGNGETREEQAPPLRLSTGSRRGGRIRGGCEAGLRPFRGARPRSACRHG